METLSPTPAKRLRFTDNSNGQITECIREFTLLQQFPSMVSSTKANNSTLKGKVWSTSAMGLNTKSPPKDSLNKLQKLKIKSLDGKDLGEVNVQVMPQMDTGGTLVTTKPGIFKKMYKPVTLSLVGNQDATKKMIKIAPPVQQSVSVKSNLGNNIIFVSDKHKLNTDHKNNFDNHKTIMEGATKGNAFEEKDLWMQFQSKNIQNKPKFIPIRPKSSSMKLVQIDDPKWKQKCVKIQNPKLIVKAEGASINEITKLDNVGTLKNSGKILQLKSQDFKFPINKCDRFILPKVKSNQWNETNELYKQIVVKNCKPSITKIKSVKNKDETFENVTEKSNAEIPEYVPLSVRWSKNYTDQNESQNAKKLGKNVMVVLHNDTVCNENTQVNHKELCNVVRAVPESELFKPHLESAPSYVAADNKTPIENKRLSDNLSILGEALGSVEDEKLREKALQALAECGIGIKRYVPITPPNHLKTVHDSAVQTNVFGISEGNVFESSEANFVLVRNSDSPIQRIKQIERENIDSAPININLNNTNLNPCCNLQLEDSLFASIPTPTRDPFWDIDSTFNALCSDNEGAGKVQQALNKLNKMHTRIRNQLQKDINSADKLDENGMASIHRAVINDRLNDVKRYLLILNTCKHNVDMQTDDGMTSLELAIKHNASPEIVKVLLEAGAKAVSTELAHDSALIIASKISSPMLSELIKYIPKTQTELLNLVDSEGYTALHYCAKNGNLEGIKALLEAGADINLKDNRSGRTALFHALENEHMNASQYLLDKGAITTINNFSGQNILSLIDNVKNLTFRASLTRMLK